MRNFFWDREAVKGLIKGVILKYLDTDFFSERKVFDFSLGMGISFSISVLPSPQCTGKIPELSFSGG